MKRNDSIRLGWFLLAAGYLAGNALAAGPAADVGQEMRKVEKGVRQPAVPEKKKPDIKVQAPPVATNTPAPTVTGEGFLFQRLEIQGDAFVLERAGLRKDLDVAVLGRRLTSEGVKAVAATFQAKLGEAGYYLASVWAPPADYGKGTCVLAVDVGRIGKVSLYERGTDRKVGYRGKYYSDDQIRDRMDLIKEGAPFFYPDLYRTVYGVNAHPDLLMDVNLKLRTVATTNGITQRHADVQADVKDRLPLHAILELGNDGTDVTEEWRAGLTLQDINLTKHDDVLTINAPFSLDFSTIQSVAGSYYLPYRWRKGGNLSLFGGYSQLETEDVVTDIDVNGDGWFAGIQATYNFINNERYVFAGSLGLQHNVINDELVVAGVATPREVAMSPVVLTLSYMSQRPDRWGGYNSIASMLSMNRAGFLGSSEDEEFELQRENAVADYFIERLQIARLQPVENLSKDPNAQWNVFSKLEAQYASEPLIPAEQKGAGGFSTVRGYSEREVLGDDGLNGTVELRTPIRKSSTLPRWFSKTPDRHPDYEGIQFLTFVDGGYVQVKDPASGQDNSYSLLGAGVGLRISLGSHVAARADWGIPLLETEESNTSGRGNFSIQLQF